MADASSSDRTSFENFVFTKLLVNDLEKSAAFYVAVFGFVELARVDAQITGRAISEIVYQPTSSGGPLFILAKFKDTTKPVTDETVLGFSTKDMAALLTRVEKAGGRVLERLESSPTSPFLTVFIHDIEGHLVQLSQAAG